jgi:antibiotic biosynthesis monooxygenase
MSVAITCFEVPSASALAIDPVPGSQLFRALARDARFPYIAVGDVEPAARAVGAGSEAVQTLSGTYEIHHVGEHAASPFGADPSEKPIVFINCFLVESGREEAAFAIWQEINNYMVAKPGYRWHRLHRRTGNAPFAFVNIVEWESAQAWQAAHDDGFRALADPARLPFVTIPTVCELLSDHDRFLASEAR